MYDADGHKYTWMCNNRPRPRTDGWFHQSFEIVSFKFKNEEPVYLKNEEQFFSGLSAAFP